MTRKELVAQIKELRIELEAKNIDFPSIHLGRATNIEIEKWITQASFTFENFQADAPHIEFQHEVDSRSIEVTMKNEVKEYNITPQELQEYWKETLKAPFKLKQKVKVNLLPKSYEKSVCRIAADWGMLIRPALSQQFMCFDLYAGDRIFCHGTLSTIRYYINYHSGSTCMVDFSTHK
jgi:hypothetical protein